MTRRRRISSDTTPIPERDLADIGLAIQAGHWDLASEAARDLRDLLDLQLSPPHGADIRAVHRFCEAVVNLAAAIDEAANPWCPESGGVGCTCGECEHDGARLPGPASILAVNEVDEGETLARDVDPLEALAAIDPEGDRPATLVEAAAAIRAARRGIARRRQADDAAALAEYVELPPLDDGPDDVFSDLTGHYTDGEATA
jgi:hypothetical protein